MTVPTFARRMVHHRRIASTCGPVSAYKALYADAQYSFLYESMESTGRRGRYSFLGGKPYLVFKSFGNRIEIRTGAEIHRITGNPIETLRTVLNGLKMDASVRPFSGGAVGYASYDAIRFFEFIPDKNPDTLGVPELFFIFPEEVLVFDHVEKTVDIVIHSDEPREERLMELSGICRHLEDSNPPRFAAADPSTDGFQSNTKRQVFMESVTKAKEYILAGDIFQVVLSQRFEFPVTSEPVRVYEALRVANPSPYMYYLNFAGLNLLGSSPEILVKVLDRRVAIRPLAGTRPRGLTPAEDAAFEKDLLGDEKERAEHIMLVDLARNDIGRICDYGTVKTADLFTIERYSKVMHLVSNVRGRLAKGKDAFDCFAACFPAGTVSGAPKVRAMEIIDELEPVRRGIYAGSIGYFDFAGNMDMCITIRTIVIHDGRGAIQAGAGVVADSDPEREYQETLNKARALFQAVRMAGG